MSPFIAWNSQPLEKWADKHAQGKFIDLVDRKQHSRRMHYIEKGTGEPVILIHGFNYDSYTWSSNIDPLAEKHKVFAIDLWGFGFSTRQPMDYGYPLFAHQVLMFMDSLGIPSASLVGHSMGGGTAITFAGQHPQRVDRLVLVDAAGMPNQLPLKGKFFQLPWVPEFLLGLNTNSVRKSNLLSNWIHNRELLTDEYFEAATCFQKVEGTTEILLAILRKNFFNTLEEEIRQLGQADIPTLVIWGRHDNSVPLRCGEEMHRLIKGSRLEVLENAGHLANFDQSDAFNKLVIDFLQE
jgi:pimeloyl-ACP methyl ester carboxylesterase